MVGALYSGWVSHRRFSPRPHRLRYRLFQLLLDLDDLGETAAVDRPRLFAVNRWGLLSHSDADHGDGSGAPLRAWVEARLSEAGTPAPGGPILLLAMPRVLGFVFNPLSLFYCQRPDGTTAAVIYEVNNTYGERHAYVLPVRAGQDTRIRQTCAKAFRVSPFMAADLVYDFDLQPPGEAVRVSVNASDQADHLVLTAQFAGRRRPFTDAVLLSEFVRLPLMTLKVVAAIYFEAVRLWLKGFARQADRPRSGQEINTSLG
jgi:hypothetical protein